MAKPETMCNETGCTREWTTTVTQYGYPVNAPVSSTAQEKKVCEPCAVMHHRQSHSTL